MHIPDDVRARWVIRTNELTANRGDLALPYASASALALAGHAPDAETVKAIEMLIRQAPDEVPLDVAPAKCRSLDSYFYDEYRRQTGARPRGPKVLEATLVSTDEMVSYMAPNLKLAWRWPWGAVTDLESVKRGSRFSRVELTSNDGEQYSLSLGTMAMDNLLTIYEWVSDEE